MKNNMFKDNTSKISTMQNWTKKTVNRERIFNLKTRENCYFSCENANPQIGFFFFFFSYFNDTEIV